LKVAVTVTIEERNWSWLVRVGGGTGSGLFCVVRRPV